MTPSSCSTAPSLISFQAKRSFTPVMVARLRIRLVAKASSFKLIPPHAPRGEVAASYADGGVMRSVPGLMTPPPATRAPPHAPRGEASLGAQSLLLGEGAVNF